MKKMLSLILALVLVVSLVPGVHASQGGWARCSSISYARIALGQTVTLTSQCYQDGMGGYAAKLFKITAEEAKNPEQTGRKLLKDGKKAIDMDAGFCYHWGYPASVYPDFQFTADKYGVGTYLLVYYAFDCDGKTTSSGYTHDKTYNYEDIAAFVIEVQKNEVPITDIDVYLCEEDGTIIEPFDLSKTVNAEYDQWYYLRFVVKPENATERVDTYSHFFDGIADSRKCNDHQDVFPIWMRACGENRMEYYVKDFADSEEKRTAVTVNFFVDHAPGAEMEVIKPNTCEKDGLMAYRCTRVDCGALIDKTTIPAKGHKLPDGAAVTAKRTATKPGKTVGQCEVCRKRNVELEIPAIFSDVKPDAFYSDALDHGYDAGWVSGLTATTFGPNASCNRAQVVTFLWRAAGCPMPTDAENPFEDVEESDYYYNAVLWAVEQGITAGVDATHFAPTQSCSRAQVVAFLYRAMGSPEISDVDCPFTDVEAGEWYELPVLWAVENGITAGLTPDTFGVNTVCNRAQVVTFLYRTYHK